MAVQPIRLFGDPVLRTPGRRGRRLRQGAAPARRRTSPTPCSTRPAPAWPRPQIGVGLRVFTWYVDGEVGHLVNPALDLSEEQQDGPEGCLSIPGLTFDCRRALSVVAHGLRHARRAGHASRARELLARAIQHETDHLDGVLFVDRLDRRDPQGWR